ncbi:hypothetical protein GCM10007382_02460 [Salinibacterium xinjiangense]|nr:hypothetical protein GCM10007382_02460 [Salinibacterium xinjiangense]
MASVATVIRPAYRGSCAQSDRDTARLAHLFAFGAIAAKAFDLSAQIDAISLETCKIRPVFTTSHPTSLYLRASIWWQR